MQGLSSSNFFSYKSSYHFQYLNCCQILYFWKLRTLNLAVLLIFYLLFLFLVFTKCQVLNLRVGRSCDQVLQRAYCIIHAYKCCSILFNILYSYCCKKYCIALVHRCIIVAGLVHINVIKGNGYTPAGSIIMFLTWTFLPQPDNE